MDYECWLFVCWYNAEPAVFTRLMVLLLVCIGFGVLDWLLGVWLLQLFQGLGVLVLDLPSCGILVFSVWGAHFVVCCFWFA